MRWSNNTPPFAGYGRRQAHLHAGSADAIAEKPGSVKPVRRLRSIVEETLLDVMFDLPSQTDIVEVIINADCVTDKNSRS